MSDVEKSRTELEQELAALRAQLAVREADRQSTDVPIPSAQINAGAAQALLRSSPAAIIMLNREGRVMLWNPAAEQLFGWREEEVLGQPNPIVPPEAADEFQRMFERELRGEVTVNEVRPRRRRDGTTIDVRIATAPLRDARGESIGVIGVLIPADAPASMPEGAGELRQLLNSVQDGVWMVDAEGVTTFVNKRLAALLGYEPEQMFGRPAAEFLAEGGESIVHEHLQQRRAGIADGYELWIPRRDEGGIWAYVAAAPILDRAGQCAGSIAMITDITAHKQAEQALEQRVQQRTAELTETNRRLQEQIAAREQAEHALRESEARFRLLAENATDLICRHAPDGRYLYVSPSSRKLLGYEPQELIGRSPYEFFHPDDVDRVQASHTKVVQWPEANRIEYRLRRKDGSYIWLETVARAVRAADSGQVLEIHTTSRDVTARHEAEEQLRLIQSAVEQIDEMVIITDTELDPPGPRIEYVNPAFCRTTGYSADEVLGQTPRMLQGPRTDRAVLDELRDQLSRGESFEGETYNYRKDGEEFILHWHIAPLRDRRGRITHFVAIQRDVTEQRRAEALARQRQSELAHVGRLSTMGEMASGIAHELNQPLAAIAIYVQGCLRRIQQQGVSDEELTEALTHIHNQAQRASEIIRRLRDFMRKREAQRNP
ncbi:MAG: PAS domain-containing sensor histidine kinase, partial [Phycisphaeraceae bacterium]